MQQTILNDPLCLLKVCHFVCECNQHICTIPAAHNRPAERESMGEQGHLHAVHRFGARLLPSGSLFNIHVAHD